MRDVAAGDEESSVVSGSSVRSMVFSSSDTVHHGLVYKETTPKFHSDASSGLIEDYRKSIVSATSPHSFLAMGGGKTNEGCEMDDSYHSGVLPGQESKSLSRAPAKIQETKQNIQKSDDAPDASIISKCNNCPHCGSSNIYQPSDVLELNAKIQELKGEIDELNNCYYLSEQNLIINTERADRSLQIASLSAIDNENLRDTIREANDHIASLSKDRDDIRRQLQESANREITSTEIVKDLKIAIEVAQSESAAVQAAVLTIELQRLQMILEKMREQAAVSLTEKSGLLSDLESVRAQLLDIENKNKIGSPSKQREMKEKERTLEQLSFSSNEIKRLEKLLSDSLYEAKLKEIEATERSRDSSVAEALRYDAVTAKHAEKVAVLNDTYRKSKKDFEAISLAHSILQIKLQKQEQLVTDYADKLQKKECSYADKLQKKECSYLQLHKALDESNMQITSLTGQLNTMRNNSNNDSLLIIDEMKEKIKEIETHNATLNISVTALQSALNDSQLEVSQKEEEIQGMDDFMKEVEDGLINESLALTNQVLLLNESISGMKSEIKEHECKQKTLQIEIDIQKSNLLETEQAGLMLRSKKETETLENKIIISALESQIASLKVEKTEAAAATTASMDGVKSEMRAEKERAKEEEAKRTREMAGLEAQIASVISSSSSKILELSDSLSESKFALFTLNASYSNLDTDILALKSVVLDLNGKIEMSEKEIIGLKEKYAILLDANALLGQEVKNHLADIFHLRKELDTSHSEVKLYKSDMEIVRKSEIEKMESVMAEKTDAENELASFKLEINDEIDEYSAENEELRKQIESLKSLSALAESKQFSLVESYELEIKRISELGEKTIADRIKEATETLLKSNKALKDEIEVLTESYVWMQNDYAETKTDFSMLEEKMEELEIFNNAERTRYEDQIILLLKAIGIYDSSLDPRDTYFVELFRLQLDEERMKIFTLKNCLVKFSENLSEEDNSSLLQAGIILAQDVIGI